MSAEVIAQSRVVMETHARTFSLAARLFPAETRDDVAVTYAFCRLVNDTVDDAPSHEQGAADLALLQEEFEGNREPRPLLQVFRECCERYGIPEGAVHELMIGVGSDVGVIRFDDDRDLLRYSYRVAGAVGLIMARLIGADDPMAMPHAVDLGVGMQITNICRDVLEDAGRDRVYLPAKRLKAHGVTQDEIIDGTASKEALGRVVSDLLLLADRYYASGGDGLHYIPRVPRAAVASAARMYRGIGVKIERGGYDVMAGRTIVGASGKLNWFMRGLAHSALCELDGVKRHDARLHEHFDGFAGVNLPSNRV